MTAKTRLHFREFSVLIKIGQGCVRTVGGCLVSSENLFVLLFLKEKKKKEGVRFRLLPLHCIAALAGTTSPLSRASNQLAWFTGSTENSHLLKRSIVRFRRRARNVSSGLFTDLKLSTCFIRAAALLNEVYPNRISTSQIRIRLGLSG